MAEVILNGQQLKIDCIKSKYDWSTGVTYWDLDGMKVVSTGLHAPSFENGKGRLVINGEVKR